MAGSTALGAAGAGLLPIAARAATSTPSGDFAQQILDLAATAEALATAFYYNARAAGSQLPNVNSDANRNYFQAATVQEGAHLIYLIGPGATPVTRQFYFPSGMFTDESVFFPTASLLEDYFIAAYIAAAIDLSTSSFIGASPYSVGVAVQILGVECEHRALLRVAANLNPPNKRLGETALLARVSDVVAPLTSFLNGGTGYTGPFALPTDSDVEAIAAPYGLASFPSVTIA